MFIRIIKMRIMAYIQTPIRLINVKETYEEVLKAMDLQWMEVTENTSFYGEMSGKIHKGERKIRLNRDYIIEIQP
jgi:hypothetical protein